MNRMDPTGTKSTEEGTEDEFGDLPDPEDVAKLPKDPSPGPSYDSPKPSPPSTPDTPDMASGGQNEEPPVTPEETFDKIKELINSNNQLQDEISDLQQKVKDLQNSSDLNTTEEAIKLMDEILDKMNQIQNNTKECAKLISGSDVYIRQNIAKFAAELAGSEYATHGGHELGWVDCCGAVYYAYSKAGVNISILDAQGYNDIMQTIDIDQLKPGDIITYSNSKQNGAITHVQVFIGEAIDKWGKKVNDAVINASPKNGVYIVGLSQYNSWSDVNDHMTPHYGRLFD